MVLGAVIGYALVAFHGRGVMWVAVGKIAASWVISPLFSGLISSGIFLLSDRFILKSQDPLAMGLRSLPFLSASTLFVNVFSILYSNAEAFGIASIGWYSILGVSIALSVVSGVVVQFVANPWLRAKILAKERERLREEPPPPYDASTVDPDKTLTTGGLILKNIEQRNTVMTFLLAGNAFEIAQKS